MSAEKVMNRQARVVEDGLEVDLFEEFFSEFKVVDDKLEEKEYPVVIWNFLEQSKGRNVKLSEASQLLGIDQLDTRLVVMRLVADGVCEKVFEQKSYDDWIADTRPKASVPKIEEKPEVVSTVIEIEPPAENSEIVQLAEVEETEKKRSVPSSSAMVQVDAHTAQSEEISFMIG